MSNSSNRLFSFIKIINVFSLLFFLISNGDKVLADTLYVALPVLNGTYDINMTRMSEFNIGTQLDSVINVSIHWSGTVTPGLGHGDGVEMPADQWFDWHTQISAMMDPDEPGFWAAYSGPFNGTFEDTALFDDFFSPSWHFLLDGHSEVTASLDPMIIIGGVMVSPPSGMIHNAELIIDAIISPTKVSENNYSTSTLSSEILFQNYPNPFNPTTTISFSLPAGSNVVIRVYDTIGHEIVTLINEQKPAGSHFIEWNGKNEFGKSMPSGLYLYSIKAGNYEKTNKMLLIK